MMHKARSSIKEVPYCFARSYVKLQGHTAKKIVEFDPDWAFPDCNSNLNLLMDMKWYTKLDVVWKICLIIFRGHPSNFKVTRAKNRRFESNLSKITRPVAAIKSLRFAFFLNELTAKIDNYLENKFVGARSSLGIFTITRTNYSRITQGSMSLFVSQSIIYH